MGISHELLRHIVVSGELGIRFPSSLPFMSTAGHGSLIDFGGYLNDVQIIFMFSFITYGRGVRLEAWLGGLRNSRSLLFNAKRVRALWPPLFLLGWFGLLNGVGELC